MKTGWVLVYDTHGPPGHGEPGDPVSDIWLEAGVFPSRGEAQQWINDKKASRSYYGISHYEPREIQIR